MIDEAQREAIRVMYSKGKGKMEIACFFGVDKKTVTRIISEEQGSTRKPRNDKFDIDPDLLKQIHSRCKGYVQRVQEVLAEEYGIKIKYSTLTRIVRERGLGKHEQKRSSDEHPDIPGYEMQQDTSPYILRLGGTRTQVVCSGLYYRYSKIRYVKFYTRFDRFRMKCFFHEALLFYGYSAKICVIDNTSLAVLHGTGENAVFHPEMKAFACNYGFEWKAHRVKHPNRKAGTERNFFTLETNFFPGRSFKSLEDLNKQAFEWAVNRFASRPQSKTRLIPKVLFEYEKPSLIAVPQVIPAPFKEHYRKVDTYGYVSLDGNYYWTPEGSCGSVKILEYAEVMKIYKNRVLLIEYALPPRNVKNKRFAPEGKTAVHQPKNRKKGYREEENRLRALDESVGNYLDYILSTDCSIKHKPKFIRELYLFSKRVSPELFLQILQRANQYKVDSIDGLESIARRLFTHSCEKPPVEVPANKYESRTCYQEGYISSEANLSSFEQLLEDEEDGAE